MEKLVMLLDIYEEQVLMKHYIGDKIEGKDIPYLISKDFGFIEWLVEHDKIDREKVIEEIGGCIKISGLGPHYTFYSALLMILAVSGNPINDLVSYLK